MKVGILTFHRAHNYGAVLQCYALKSVISSLGHDVHVIDYRQPFIENAYRFHFSFSKKRMKEMNFLKIPFYIGMCFWRDIKQLFIINKKKRVFERFQKQHLNLTEKFVSSIPSDFDCYVIGSDMLWSDECMGHTFDSFYLGDFPHKKGSRVVGYAISGTPDSFTKLGDSTDFGFITNFDALSVRESTLASIISKYAKTQIPQCIDPTLLTTKELWSSLIKQINGKRGRDYIVTYFLRRVNVSIFDKINRFAKENKLDVVDIDVSPFANPISVESFVSIIANARYIVTDSFHGIVFSMIFERPFNAMTFNDAHDMRYVDILKRIGLDKVIITPDFTPSIPQIDYSIVNKNIEDFRKDSSQYLKDNI